VSTFDHDAPSLRPGVSVHLQTRESTETLAIESLRHAANGVLLRLAGIRSRIEAEARQGADVFVDEDALPHLGPGEVWAYRLAGCAVVDPEGRPLGVVECVTAGKAHDFLCVRTNARVFEVPLVQSLVLRLDDVGRTVTVRPVPGLLDDDDAQ
jgi:16S rRNA processing protein RimM